MTDQSPQCPIPEVAEALSPYIKTRQEVAAIRQALQARVHREITVDDSPLSSVNLHTQFVPPDQKPSSAFTGVRRAYLQALQAHAAAQARYDALVADLEKSKNVEPAASEPSKDGISVQEDYLPILRHRERQRKLRAINRAFTDISATSGGLTALSLDRVVQTAGNPPVAPSSESSSQFKQQDWDVETRIVELKKAILAAKRGIQASSSAPPPQPPTPSKTDPEVTGLQSALNELTVWMEQQLQLISSATDSTDPTKSSAPPTPTTTTAASPSAPRQPASLAYISTLYDTYLNARAALIHTVHNPPVNDVEHFTAPLFAKSTRRTFAPPTPDNPSSATPPSTSQPVAQSTPSETLLPYIPALMSVKTASETLLTSNSYIRHQIASGEDSTHKTMVRLRDESHLLSDAAAALPSSEHGSVKGKHWSLAADHAGDELKQFVERKVTVGIQRAGEAEGTLADMGNAMRRLESLDR